jgi:hypothetical protein
MNKTDLGALPITIGKPLTRAFECCAQNRDTPSGSKVIETCFIPDRPPINNHIQLFQRSLNLNGTPVSFE